MRKSWHNLHLAARFVLCHPAPVVPQDLTSESFRELREEIGLSQRELAEYLGVNTRTVGRWELGRARIPHAAALALLALALTRKARSK